MTMVACGRMQWPRTVINQITTGSLSFAAAGLTLDSTSDALAWVGNSPVTDTLTKIYFRTGTVTTGADVDVRIETVANGQPTGSLWATDTNAVVTVADGDDAVWKTATLTAAASLTIGAEFAIVIASSAGTPNMQLLGTQSNPVNGSFGLYPIIWHNTTGAYAKIDNKLMWCVEFSGGVVELPGILPQNGSFTTTAFNSGSATDEYALRFVAPFKCRCIGMRVMLGNFVAGSQVTLSLWDATGDTDAEALGQAVFDGDSAGTVADGYVEVIFDAANTLTAGTTYYAGARSDTANNITIFNADAAGTGAATNGIKGFTGNSAELYLASRAWTAGTAGAWSTTTTSRPFIELIFDQLDNGEAAVGRAIYQIGL